MSMLAANHMTEQSEPNGGVREGLKELKEPYPHSVGWEVLGPVKAYSPV